MRTNTRFGRGVRSGLLLAALVAAGGCGGPLDVEDDGTPPAGGGDVGGPAEGVVSSALTSSETVMGGWQCFPGQSCEDRYEIVVNAANTLVTMRITAIAGSSAVRLGAYAPNSTTNLLTGGPQAWTCPAGGTGQDFPQSVSFKATATGTYRLILGRDATRSTGGSGSYTVVFEGDPSIGTSNRIADNMVPPTGTGSQCGWLLSQNNNWSCPDRGCQHIYDFDVQANTVLRPVTTAPTGNSAVRLAIFGPGTPLSGPNLLTGRNLDRQCVGVGVSDSTRLLARTAGRYRIAVGRDQALSTGNSGNMIVNFNADKPMIFLGQTATNAATGETGAACGFQFVQSLADWICPSGTTCQDVYDFDAEPSAAITAAVSSVTGGSRVRLALFNLADRLDVTNLFNGKTTDRACVGANAPDTATSSLAFKKMRLAVGRDGGSAGTTGTYRLTVTTTNTPLAVFGRTANNIPTQLSTSSCP